MAEKRDYRFGDGLDLVEDADDQVASTDADDHEEPKAHRPSLAALLVEAGYVSDDQVKSALDEGTRTGEKLGEVVVRRGWCTEAQLGELLAKQWELSFIKAESLSIDPLAVRRLSVSDAREVGAVPVWFEKEQLMVAVAEPNEERFAAVQEIAGDVGFVVVARSALERLLNSRLTAGDQKEPAPAPLIQDEPAVVAPLRSVFGSTSGSVEPSGSDVTAVLDSLETAASGVKALKGEVETLRESLRRANEELAEQSQKLAEIEAAHERDSKTIRRLEDDLADRSDLFGTLKTKVAELSEALASQS